MIVFELAVRKGPGTGSSATDAARELVAEAVQNGRQVPARWALLLATADWCNPTDSLPAAVRRELSAELGYEVPLIGGSMAKLYSSSDPAGIIDQGIVLTLWRSEHVHATTAFLKDPYLEIEPDRAKVERLARELETRAKVRLGSSAERYLFGIFPGFLSDGRAGRRNRVQRRLPNRFS